MYQGTLVFNLSWKLNLLIFQCHYHEYDFMRHRKIIELTVKSIISLMFNVFNLAEMCVNKNKE